MYKLDVFKRSKKPLRDIMVWGRIIMAKLPDQTMVPVVINKDGSLQTTWKYHGPDLDAAVQEELSFITYQLQQDIAAMKSRFAIYFEAQRTPATAYPTTNYFPDKVTKGMDQERRELFEAGHHYESQFYATLYWFPPKDNREKIRKLVVEGSDQNEQKEANGEDILSKFTEQLLKTYHSFLTLQIPVSILSANDLVTYLHSTVSAHMRRIHVPAHPMLMDKYVYDTPLYGGLEPRLGKKHIRVIAPVEYTKKTTEFGFFNVFNQLDFDFRWVTRCVCMSKQDDLAALENMRRQWYAKLQSVWSYVFHSQDQNPEVHNDEHVVNRVQEIKAARLAVEEDTLGFVFYSTAVVVMDEDRDMVEEKARSVRQVFSDCGLKAIIEDVNAVDAWLGCVPGLIAHNIRRALISTGNFVHLMPLSSIWAGPEWNAWLNGPPLLYTLTNGNTPYRLNLHVGQVGHTLLAGPTGNGKSVHLCCLEAAFRRYKNARVIIFDNGASSKVLTYGVGGRFYDLGNEQSTLSFQPLAQINDLNERQWAQEWLCDFLTEEHVTVTPQIKEMIRDALNVLVGMEIQQKTISNFISFLQDEKLKQAFASLSLEDAQGNPGEYGKIFDSDKDTLELSSWQTFEMGKIMEKPPALGPLLMYIFHRIECKLKSPSEQRMPTLIVLDESWMFFENPLFAHRIESWLRTLRKYDACVVFATQQLEDIVKSPLLDVVLSSCPSHIFLPDPTASARKDIYKKFQLNQRQIEILADARPQKDYYYTSPEGSRLYDLALECCPFSLAYVAVNKEGLQRCDQLIKQYGQEHFNEYWLKEHNLTMPEGSVLEKIVL